MNIFEQLFLLNVDVLKEKVEGVRVRHNYSGATGRIVLVNKNAFNSWEFHVKWEHASSSCSTSEYMMSDLDVFTLIG